MSTIGQIGINLELLAQNISRMQEQAATMPPPDDVRRVEGAQEEPAQANYWSDLYLVAYDLAAKTRRVRSFVERNAEALERAANALQETDGADSLAARQANAFVQSIVTTPAGPMAPAAATTPTAVPPSNGSGATTW